MLILIIIIRIRIRKRTSINPAVGKFAKDLINRVDQLYIII